MFKLSFNYIFFCLNYCFQSFFVNEFYLVSNFLTSAQFNIDKSGFSFIISQKKKNVSMKKKKNLIKLHKKQQTIEVFLLIKCRTEELIQNGMDPKNQI